MDPLLIQYELRRRFGSQKAFARRIQVNDSSLSLILNKKRMSRAIRSKIAKAIGRKYHDVWGSKTAA